MNLMEKYRKKFEASERAATPDNQVVAQVMAYALPEKFKEAYQERAAIMEYDGGLDRQEAERQAWCRTACMLTFPSQWRECERFKPCPKVNLNRMEG